MTTAPPEFSKVDEYAFQPCEGNGDSSNYGAVGTRWMGLDAAIVVPYYQKLARDGDWHLDSCSSTALLLCAEKDVDETSVSFTVEPYVDENGNPGYATELRYPELGR